MPKGPAGNEVNLASQEVAQLDEQAARLPARRVALIEAHQQIQIAIRVRRAFSARAEQLQRGDAVAAAEVG